MFYRRPGFRVVLQPLVMTLVLEKKVFLCIPHAVAFRHGQDPEQKSAQGRVTAHLAISSHCIKFFGKRAANPKPSELS